jgi:hypothetical protein
MCLSVSRHGGVCFYVLSAFDDRGRKTPQRNQILSTCQRTVSRRHEMSRECHESVTRVSRDVTRVSQNVTRVAKSDSLQSNFGPGQIRFPPVKLWLFSILTDLFPPFLTPPKVTECHRMSRKCHESVTECHESVTECHGMSRECHESVTECHEMSRRRLDGSRRVSRLHSPVNA